MVYTSLRNAYIFLNMPSVNPELQKLSIEHRTEQGISFLTLQFSLAPKHAFNANDSSLHTMLTDDPTTPLHSQSWHYAAEAAAGHMMMSMTLMPSHA